MSDREDPEPISMSSEAIMQRLREVEQLNKLCSILSESKPILQEEPPNYTTHNEE